MQKNESWKAVALWLLCAAALCLFLTDPATAAKGVQSGLHACVETIIPTMFPFFVLSRILLSGQGAVWLSWPLRPLTIAMGITSPKAPSAVVCGWLGGFAAGADQVSQLYRQREISKKQGSLLLIASTVSGPSFVAAGVGARLLGNAAVGWMMFAAQCAAAALCAILFSFIIPQEKGDAGRKAGAVQGKGCDASEAVASAVQATTILCGYVTLFSFLSAYAAPLGNGVRYAMCFFLEVTNACIAAAESDTGLRVAMCAAALSAMGASVFLQVRAFAGKEISLKPLLISRVVHLPLMLFFTRLLLSMFPSIRSAAVWENVYASRLPADAACVLFVLCALAMHGKTEGLRKQKKRV